MTRADYVGAVVQRVVDLCSPPPPGYWRDGRAWVRFNHLTLNVGANEAAEDFVAGRSTREQFDDAMKRWMEAWKQDQQEHRQGVPL